MKAKKWIFVVIIGLFIAVVVFFNTVLNMSSFRSSRSRLNSRTAPI